MVSAPLLSEGRTHHTVWAPVGRRVIGVPGTDSRISYKMIVPAAIWEPDPGWFRTFSVDRQMCRRLRSLRLLSAALQSRRASSLTVF
jgi:hypothetical protein